MANIESIVYMDMCGNIQQEEAIDSGAPNTFEITTIHWQRWWIFALLDTIHLYTFQAHLISHPSQHSVTLLHSFPIILFHDILYLPFYRSSLHISSLVSSLQWYITYFWTVRYLLFTEESKYTLSETTSTGIQEASQSSQPLKDFTSNSTFHDFVRHITRL